MPICTSLKVGAQIPSCKKHIFDPKLVCYIRFQSHNIFRSKVLRAIVQRRLQASRRYLGPDYKQFSYLKKCWILNLNKVPHTRSYSTEFSQLKNNPFSYFEGPKILDGHFFRRWCLYLPCLGQLRITRSSSDWHYIDFSPEFEYLFFIHKELYFCGQKPPALTSFALIRYLGWKYGSTR